MRHSITIGMHLLVLLYSGLLTPCIGSAQVALDWDVTFGGADSSDDEVKSLVADEFGSIFVSGSLGYDKGAVLKYTPSGTVAWEIHDSDTLLHLCGELHLDSVGNLIIATRANGGGPYGSTIVTKLTGGGNVLWQDSVPLASYWEDSRSFVAVDVGLGGSIYVAGVVTGSSGNCLGLCSLSPEGQIEWVGSYCDSTTTGVYSSDVVCDMRGGVYVGGKSVRPFDNLNALIARFDNSGSFLWAREYNGPVTSTERTKFVRVDRDGNAITFGNTDGNQSRTDMLIAKYSLDGDSVWVLKYGSTGLYETIGDATVDEDGNVLVCGMKDYNRYLVALKIGAAGELLWEKSLGFDTEGLEYDSQLITEDGYGNVVVATSMYATELDLKIAVGRIDSHGDSLDVQCFDGSIQPPPGSVGFDDFSTTIQRLAPNSFAVAGQTLGSTKLCIGQWNYLCDRDWLLLKYTVVPDCPCLADPKCDGSMSDVSDVVATINVAFRGYAPARKATCGFDDADVDCNGAVDVLDVINVVDVAFRGAEPLATYCQN